MARFGRDPAVKRLADLSYNQQIVDSPLAQRTEQVRPTLRQGLVPSTEYLGEFLPWIGRRRFAGGEICYGHAERKYICAVGFTTRLSAMLGQKSSVYDRNDSSHEVLQSSRPQQRKSGDE
jgi:hypothetical protein